MARRILLIESDPMLRSFWIQTFQNEGLEVVSAENEVQAQREMGIVAPDLIFLGSNMDGAKGVSLMQRLNSQRSDLLVVAPLNVSTLRRQLKAAHDQGTVTPRIHLEKLTYAVKEALTLKEASLFGELSIAQMERQMIGQALQRARGNQTRAARLLGISRFALRNRLKKYRLAPQEHEEAFR